MKTDSHLPQFADLMSEYVNFISGIGKCDYITRIYLNSFAKYCMNHAECCRMILSPDGHQGQIRKAIIQTVTDALF